MTKDKAMKLALEALTKLTDAFLDTEGRHGDYERQALDQGNKALASLQEALAQPEQEPVLQDIEQYRLQMAGISTAAIGYWKEIDSIHPDYDTLALRDVAKLYAKYDELYKTQPVSHGVIAGALFDFMAWLTTRDKRLVLSGADEAGPAVDAIRDFAKMRGLSLDDAQVQNWREALAEQPAQQEPEFFTHNVEQPYDWAEWVCPDPKSYLMKCCDCGLVHEAEFGVVRYKSETEREDCEPVDDPNLQAVFRMRRSEQWSPADTAHRAGGLPMEQPAQQCKWPTCQSEEYQQALAEQIRRELVGEQPAPKVVDCHATGVCVQSGLRAEQPAPAITPEHLLALAQTASLELDKVIEAFKMAEQREVKDVVIDNMGDPFIAKAYVTPQPAQQEPVAWMSPSWIDPDTRGWQSDSFESIPIEGWLPLYTTPPQRTWVGLTNKDIYDCEPKTDWYDSVEFAEAIEAKLKEKNT